MNNPKKVSPQGEMNQSEIQVSNTELASASMDMGSQNDTHADLSEAPIQERQFEKLSGMTADKECEKDKPPAVERDEVAMLDATNDGDRLDLAVKVISIFTSMSAQDSERINNAEKTETQTREQVIHTILDEMYNKNN